MKVPIAYDERVANYFVNCDDRFTRNEQEVYEHGGVCVFSHFEPDCDLNFLRSIPNPPTNDKFLKKGKLKHFLSPIGFDQFDRHLLSKLFASQVDGEYFQIQLKRLLAQTNGFVKQAFPSYQVIDTSHTFRFTIQPTEELHYDSYADQEDEHSNLRIFVNLDTAPRVWAVSHRVWDQMDELELAPENVHPNEFNKRINARLTDYTPKHHVIFPPLSMWICNSQTIGHQIIFGRRLLALTYKINTNTLASKEFDFYHKMRRKLSGSSM